MVKTLSILPFDFPYGPIFIIVAVVVIFYLWTQYRQKMELIKKGENIVNLDSLEQMKANHLSKGIIAITLALGILSGYLMETHTALIPLVAYTSMILLFFGLGALVFYVLIRNR